MKPTRMRSLGFAASAVAVAIAFAPPADAQETKACITAFDEGQRLRAEHKLRAAREQLLVCSRQLCPAVIRSDCAGVLQKVEEAQPTVVLSAADRKGNDLPDVTVDLDGHRIAERLTGHAISVDPGPLKFRFEKKPWDPVIVEAVVVEGDKNRVVKALLGPIPPPEAGPVTPLGPGRPTNEPPPSRSVVGWAVPIGFATLGAIGFTIAGVTRLGLGEDADALERSCAPACPPDQKDALYDDLRFANIALVAGIGSVVLGVASFFVLGPSGARAAPLGQTAPRARGAQLELRPGGFVW